MWDTEETFRSRFSYPKGFFFALHQIEPLHVTFKRRLPLNLFQIKKYFKWCFSAEAAKEKKDWEKMTFETAIESIFLLLRELS